MPGSLKLRPFMAPSIVHAQDPSFNEFFFFKLAL
jgi:hypothetical protein